MAIEITPVHIDAEIAQRVDNALDSGRPIVVAYVDQQGQAKLSFRGTTQSYSDDQLAMWIREPKGGLLAALPNNNRISLLYRDKESRITYIFYGTGNVVSDPAVAKAIFEKSPERERNKDPEMHGAAIIMDVDTIQGVLQDQPFLMRRDVSPSSD